MPADTLADLAAYPVGLLESAVAKLGRRPRSAGVSVPGLRPLRSAHARVLGFAIPAQVSVENGEPYGRRENLDWWRYIEQFGEQVGAGPYVVVAQDISSDPSRGVACGRLSAHIYAALGCKGLVTNGYVRDAGTLGDLDFALFGRGPSALHGNPHVVRFGSAVEILGVSVNPGDVIAADGDGMIAFPAAWLADVVGEAQALDTRTQPIYRHCRSGKATAESIARILAPQKTR